MSDPGGCEINLPLKGSRYIHVSSVVTAGAETYEPRNNALICV
jgi:hypothetical protein